MNHGGLRKCHSIMLEPTYKRFMLRPSLSLRPEPRPTIKGESVTINRDWVNKSACDPLSFNTKKVSCIPDRGFRDVHQCWQTYLSQHYPTQGPEKTNETTRKTTSFSSKYHEKDVKLTLTACKAICYDVNAASQSRTKHMSADLTKESFGH